MLKSLIRILEEHDKTSFYYLMKKRRRSLGVTFIKFSYRNVLNV